MGLYSGGLIIRGIFASEIWGGGEGGYFREGVFSVGLIIGILQYMRRNIQSPSSDISSGTSELVFRLPQAYIDHRCRRKFEPF